MGASGASRRIEELDWSRTPWGEIILRRRWDPTVQRDVYEILLGDEFLMSSLFTVAETEMVRLGLADLAGDDLDVVVGGLGLGYTARAVLAQPRVAHLVVVEALAPVIDWHRRGLVPGGDLLSADLRCRLVEGDFFQLLRSASGLDSTQPGRRFDAAIVDIDHSPRHLLHPSHADFYRPEGLRRMAQCLKPGGSVALWSNDPVDGEFTATLSAVFGDVKAEVVSFPNPMQSRPATNTVYIARRV